jgi:hypothetical protein
MNSRWATLVAASLIAFACFAIAWQFQHHDEFFSIAQACIRGEQLAKISDIVERDKKIIPASGACRLLDLMLPKDAHVFMPDMTGATNYNKIGIYFLATYYLFPREIGTSLDHITRMTKDGFLGKTSESDQEILTNGFDVRMDFTPDGGTATPLGKLSIKDLVNPVWFDSNSDRAVAFLLPLLTALAGMWLFRFLFPALSERMPLLEQLAGALGLGMMAVAALTLGVKLCGFHGRGLMLMVTAVGAVAEIWRNRKVLLTQITDTCSTMVRSPITAVFVAIGLLVFLILFRIAGVEGLVDGDAFRWMLKAKIIHLYTGNDLVQWFSNPALSHAHLDYPTLVPSLHAVTYDSIGHVDEFVTKFWPAWMLLFLLAALASLNHAGKSRFHAPSFALLGLLLLPAIQIYVQGEGGTLPMIFFTVLGFVQCALWLAGKDRARLGLGLTLLFGAAMTKFEGFIFLALVGSWMLLVPAARPSLKPSPRLWRVLAFCFLAALPFVCLRIQIQALNYESGWAGYAAHNPGATLSNWPCIVLMQLARFFANYDFANWSGDGGQFHWIGRWAGFSSLYNQSTLGLAWFCLLMTVALWFAVPARRPVILWMLAMLVGATVALSGVFASIVSIKNLSEAVGYTNEGAGGRYLLPVLLAWFATMMTLFFADPSSSATTSKVKPGKPARGGRNSKR